ncbi:MAG: transposase [Mesoflavibacter sp.]|nr:transposase [Mesoflavibacter sp.]
MNQLSANLTKQIQNSISRYFKKASDFLTKAESRSLREMVTGILKSQQVFINQIATGICDPISLKQTTKRFRRHYNKIGFWKKVNKAHLESVKGKINHGDYALIDISDIQKKYARMMEGLDFVKDGDTGKTGLGYWLMNVIIANKHRELTPLYSKLYSFDAGSLSENKEVMLAIGHVKEILKKAVTWVIDRGGDRSILKDFCVKNIDQFIMRLKKNTSLIFNEKSLGVKEIKNKIKLDTKLSAVKIKKSKRKTRHYIAGATKVGYMLKDNQVELWLVVVKNLQGGFSYFLLRSAKENKEEVIEECFKAYGLRWKIEEYHRHIKQQYHLEDIQVKKFEGLQSMLSILNVAMCLIYREISGFHIKLLLESGIKTMNKGSVYELFNFVYYKIGNIVKILLAHVNPRAFLPDKNPKPSGQLCFDLNWMD